MSETAIKVERLGKKYRIGARRPYKTIRESLMQAIGMSRSAHHSKSSENKDAGDTFWALKDVSFEVRQGEVIGIIGRNGAGKSTLLKILSRITDPTSGQVELVGRIGCLLEVGTGFHPELTGRENVFLNGAILGMQRGEIESRFDEIVAFSEIEAFLDTPVKHYSSGMYTRLAFAVAAHLEPEILIVDEVLAVGDAEFQKKCLGKMKDVAGGGRTVLFVSHNMAAVQSLCGRGIVLAHGQVAFDGDAGEAVHFYSDAMENRSTAAPQDGTFRFSAAGRTGTRRNILESLQLMDASDKPTTKIRTGAPARLVLRMRDLASVPGAVIGMRFRTFHDVPVSTLSTRQSPITAPDGRGSLEDIVIDIPDLPLTPGLYTLGLNVKDRGGDTVDAIRDACTVEVIESLIFGNGYRMDLADGLVYIRSSWRVAPVPDPEIHGQSAVIAP